jgi:hypothetical protein
MSKLRGKLTYANVIATLALFIAVGGASAFAASHLAKNSVGTKQLKNGAVTAAKVKSGSLLASNFKAGQLPAGQPGATGPAGPQGPPGTLDTSQFYDKATSDARFVGNGSSGTTPTVQSAELKDTAPGPNLGAPHVTAVLSVPGFGTLQSKCSNIGSPPTNVAMQLDFTKDSAAGTFLMIGNESNFVPSLSPAQTNQVKVAILSGTDSYDLTAAGGGFQLLSSNGSGRGATQTTIQLMNDGASGAFETATIDVAGAVSLSDDDCQAAATVIRSSK